MTMPLLSSPNETYEEHIQRALEVFGVVFPRFQDVLARVLEKAALEDALRAAIRLHDLGKLTKTWQERVGSGRRLPAHAAIGAAYLWHHLGANLRGPISFAVAIHHSDRGLLGDNIEKPDVQAVLDHVVDSSTNSIAWDDRARLLSNDLFPNGADKMTLEDLRQFARGLRTWARGCSYIEQHKRRMQASLVHHALKLCDIAAATKRKDWEGEKKSLDEADLYGGWLMVRQIAEYVESLTRSKVD